MYHENMISALNKKKKKTHTTYLALKLPNDQFHTISETWSSLSGGRKLASPVFCS
jgi:hypothetical protein